MEPADTEGFGKPFKGDRLEYHGWRQGSNSPSLHRNMVDQLLYARYVVGLLSVSL